MPSALRPIVAARDEYRCATKTSEENCGLAMQLDHIVPEVAGGATEEKNLCQDERRFGR